MGPKLDFEKFGLGPYEANIEVARAMSARWECLWHILNRQQCGQGKYLMGKEFGNERS